MKPNYGENMEYGLRSPLLGVVEGYSGVPRENLQRWPNGHLRYRILSMFQFSSYGIFLFVKTRSNIVTAGK